MWILLQLIRVFPNNGSHTIEVIAILRRNNEQQSTFKLDTYRHFLPQSEHKNMFFILKENHGPNWFSIFYFYCFPSVDWFPFLGIRIQYFRGLHFIFGY